MNDKDESRGGASQAPAVVDRGSPGGSPFALYKPNQGTYVRWCSAIGGFALALAGVAFLYNRLGGLGQNTEQIQLLVPVAALAVLTYLIFWAVGQHKRIVDFMIATEGEMKKVNWSTRREVLGATRVVIFTIFAMGLLLAAVNFGFILFFEAIGILKLGILRSVATMFGFGGGE